MNWEEGNWAELSWSEHFSLNYWQDLSLLFLPVSQCLRETKLLQYDINIPISIDSMQVLHEAGFINRSLYVLGKVIAGLVRTGGDLNHKDVPFRDSKLTKLLISSLGGRTRTLLIACVTEANGSVAETLRTLKFRWDLLDCMVVFCGRKSEWH